MAIKMIQSGAWVQVRIMVDGVLQAIGFASGCSFDEDWAIQPCNVLNYLGPVSYDSQSYSCNINVSLFVPASSAVLVENPVLGGVSISDLLPTRSEIQADGKGKQFDLLTFYDTAGLTALYKFRNVILASNGVQVAPNTYITANMRFIAVERIE